MAVPGDVVAAPPRFSRPTMVHATRRLVLLAALAACSHSSPSVVTFGAAGPWSEAYGEANRKGIQLALEEINASADWSGKRHLDIKFENDSGSGVVAGAVAQRFVKDSRIVAVIGHVNSGAMVTAARVYDGQLAAVATTATSPSLTGISPWAFRVISSDSANGLTIANYANRLGRRRAGVLYENNSYGRGLVENFRRSFAGSIVSIDPIGDGPDQNFEVYVSWFKRQQPDLVFVAGTDASGRAFVKEARRQQLTAALIGGDGWQTLASDPAADGVIVGSPFSADDKRPDVQAFVAAYRRKYDGAIPDGNAALAYDATKLLATAVVRVGADRSRIRDHLASLREPYAGVTGPIRFSPDGDPIGKGIVMTRVHNGALQLEGGR
jgi:branched-chain amino acid transport system substrate-binding protein